MAEPMPVLKVSDLDAGNAPILEFAASIMPTDGAEITFQVQYAQGDVERGDFWSTPDTITVTRGGEIHAAATE